MKLYLPFFIILLLASCSRQESELTPELQALYEELDQEIANSEQYEQSKVFRIAQLRKSYAAAPDEKQRTMLINRLIEEFNAYNADSTIYYINMNLRRPIVYLTPGEHTRLTIRRADVLAHAGLFSDALAIMQKIPRDSLTPNLMEAYYSTYCATYQYLSEYSSEHDTALDNERLRALYADSLHQVVAPNSFNHMVFVMADIARDGNTQEAIDGLSNYLKGFRSGTREYSILASTLAYMYKTAGMLNEYKRHIALSAISDVKAVVKENMSFREAATIMFEDGDIERANRYLKKSIADANFYSAMMRNAQSSKMLPVIDGAYTSMQNQLNHRLRSMVLVSSVLSVILIITILFILKQIRSLHRANDEVNKANRELSLLSERFKQANIELAEKNDELKDFNHTKEQYAGLFMAYCSSAISILQHYQQSLRVQATKGGSMASLLKKIESTEISDQLLKDFYVKFDDAILNIYPSFVDKFNALLRDDEQIVLKSGERLNTELRLYALIRIGIDDNARIAEFLRCSISTVYTYRSRIKKRAIDPERFEENVKNLG